MTPRLTPRLNSSNEESNEELLHKCWRAECRADVARDKSGRVLVLFLKNSVVDMFAYALKQNVFYDFGGHIFGASASASFQDVRQR